jgi:uncharacterized protein with HEPN domain
MSRHEDELRLTHMLDHALEAMAMCRGRERADLDRDRMLNLALVRLVEIVGEAANRVSDARQQRHPEIPWRQVIGVRNRIAHGYDQIDYDILWAIVRDDLPPLVDQLRAALGRA